MISRYHEVLTCESTLFSKVIDEYSRGITLSANNRDIVPLMKASAFVQQAATLFHECDSTAEVMLNVMKAQRKISRAQEAIFNLRYDIREIDSFFREEDDRQPNTVKEGLSSGDEIIHSSHEDNPYARDCFSLYIPEISGDIRNRPLIIALHGGHGHGRDFLWTWLREARSRRFFLLVPTSKDMTWAITRPWEDLSGLEDLVEKIIRDYPVDRSRVLLSGFSDGATYTLRCAMLPGSIFSDFQPVSGVLPPGDLSYVKGKRILWIHGAYDWMFPAVRAKEGHKALLGSGADITLKIITDLAHSYPREENRSILAWFVSSHK